ncbi:hypothetical protein [Marivita sp. S0852]|uniref:hypothetical protein n=1 Tax=Marivita sp. S0852 TaxID=3373893 RepID=UPI003981B5EB
MLSDSSLKQSTHVFPYFVNDEEKTRLGPSFENPKKDKVKWCSVTARVSPNSPLHVTQTPFLVTHDVTEYDFKDPDLQPFAGIFRFFGNPCFTFAQKLKSRYSRNISK